MRKKIKIFLFLIIAFFLLPLFSFSQRRILCCQLGRSFTVDKVYVYECARGSSSWDDRGWNTSFTFPEGAVVVDLSVKEDPDTYKCYLGDEEVKVPNASGFTSCGYNIYATKAWGILCLMDTICTITDYVYWFGLIFATIFLCVAGYFFLTAGGDPYKISQAKSFVLWAVIGVAILVLSKAITWMLQGILL